MSTVTITSRRVLLSLLALLSLGLGTARPVRGEIAAPEPEPGVESTEATEKWAASLDRLASGLAVVLDDPPAWAVLRDRMTASPLPENTVRVLDLLEAELPGGTLFVSLLAKAAGSSEKELREELAAFPTPITLFFPREEDREATLAAGSRSGTPSLEVTWDPFWVPQKSLGTLLTYDSSGQQTLLSIAAPPSGPTLVVSTENSQAPELPLPPTEKLAGSSTKATCVNPFLELTHVYLVDDHEGWPRGKPEFEIFLADWNSSMPGNQLVIQPTTKFIFSGRNIVDAAGRSRYLLDVNDKKKWYGFTPPIAMFAYHPFLGSGLYAVEDDSAAGVLKVTGSYSIGFKCSVFPGCVGTQCSGCKPSVSGFVNLVKAIWGSGDDRFPTPFRSVGGTPMDQILEQDMGDWRLRYRVACP